MAYQDPGQQHLHRENLSSYQSETMNENEQNLTGSTGETVNTVEVEPVEPVDDELQAHGELWNYLSYVSSCFEEGKILKYEKKDVNEYVNIDSTSDKMDENEIDIDDGGEAAHICSGNGRGEVHGESIKKGNSKLDNKVHLMKDLEPSDSRSALYRIPTNTDRAVIPNIAPNVTTSERSSGGFSHAEHSDASCSARDENMNVNTTDASCGSEVVSRAVTVTIAAIMSSRGQYVCRQI